jgi:hypothetical protein
MKVVLVTMWIWKAGGQKTLATTWLREELISFVGRVVGRRGEVQWFSERFVWLDGLGEREVKCNRKPLSCFQRWNVRIRPSVNSDCWLLGFVAVYSCRWLQTIRRNVSFPSVPWRCSRRNVGHHPEDYTASENHIRHIHHREKLSNLMSLNAFTCALCGMKA